MTKHRHRPDTPLGYAGGLGSAASDWSSKAQRGPTVPRHLFRAPIPWRLSHATRHPTRKLLTPGARRSTRPGTRDRERRLGLWRGKGKPCRDPARWEDERLPIIPANLPPRQPNSGVAMNTDTPPDAAVKAPAGRRARGGADARRADAQPSEAGAASLYHPAHPAGDGAGRGRADADRGQCRHHSGGDRHRVPRR